jgi:hypothetical protein
MEERVAPNSQTADGMPDAFNEIMDALAEDGGKDNINGVRKNHSNGGWFIGCGMSHIFKCWRDYIRVHGVCDMSYFAGHQFDSLIKERNVAPLSMAYAKTFQVLITEILESQKVVMTKSANKRA